MDGNAADVVRMCLEHVHTLQGVVVEDADLHVILHSGRRGKILMRQLRSFNSQFARRMWGSRAFLKPLRPVVSSTNQHQVQNLKTSYNEQVNCRQEEA